MGALPVELHRTTSRDASERFRLWRLRCMLAFARRGVEIAGSLDALLARAPVLCTYVDEAAQRGFDGLTLEAAIAQIDAQLAARADGAAIPLERLRRALDLDADAVSIFMLCGLAEGDPRLAPAIDAMLGHDGRPTRALVSSGFDAPEAVRALGRLLAAGFI